MSEPRRPRPTTPAASSGGESGAEEWDDRTPTRELAFQAVPTLLVIGQDPEVAAQLRKRLDRATHVIAIDSQAALVRQLRLIKGQPRMLIVDLRQPHRLLDVVLPFPDLLASSVVVVWGGPPGVETSLRSTFSAARVLRCDAETTIPDLATIVRLGAGR